VIRWLRKQWHRFTLWRTARPIQRSPYYDTGGSAAHVAYMIETAVHDGLPICVAHEIVTRRATDVPPGTIRIVLETCA
jgi:hypothetical protein